MYSEDAKTILDMIHLDTEKMIAEITQKYGDIDEYDPIKNSKEKLLPKSSSAVDLKPKDVHDHKEHGFLSGEDDANFSSDSLEDCSLDLDLHTRNPNGRAKASTKSVCRKHNRRNESSGVGSTFPKRSVSDYFIYDQFQLNTNRNVSLSDILNEDDDDNKENTFLNSQRHSSASFFLGPNAEKKSQESLLSDDISGGNGSYFNSMESILSDDSECKSAPLEALFIRAPKPYLPRQTGNFIDTSSASKSYGSSPNASSGFDYFMQSQATYDVSQYGYENLLDNRNVEPNTPVTQACQMVSSTSYPWITQSVTKASDEFIPRLNQSKNVVVSKSLSKEFADHRHFNNTNPIYGTASSDSGTTNSNAKPVLPAKPHIKRVDIFADPTVYIMKKSCSFDIDMFDGRRMQRSTKKYEQNLEKFEKERKMSGQFGGTLEMDYVPHKPPPANRRSTSMKNKRHSRDKERYHTVGQIPCSDRKSSSLSRTNDEEKSFEIYIAEKGATENDNQMDSLEFYAKPKVMENSVDSLDGLEPAASFAGARHGDSIVSTDFLTQAEYLKFRDIEKKIDVINKLVEMEERKLEQERIMKENRLKPFQCDSKQKGYVKSLTMNFDNLAKISGRAEAMGNDDVGKGSGSRMKRNFSLPDVLEGAKFQTFEILTDDQSELGLHYVFLDITIFEHEIGFYDILIHNFCAHSVCESLYIMVTIHCMSINDGSSLVLPLHKPAYIHFNALKLSS